ncbi:hypothetical protein [Nitrobacter vulgaris]|uniref:Uncharacterized protein n=1 Tax=Nitrobacter vulgaris TaxID=29421 RepID=A0A1V4HYN0_NITVU|nr:hypothetical protein [Nitrobacter vulgaris]OPH83024.1 hypothetical protein B2M20_08510 [Nitrobacter vulgaris]
MKKPEEFERRKLPSKEERAARKVLRKADARVAMAEHENAAEAFAKNRERLREERLAREAAEPHSPPKKKKADS